MKRIALLTIVAVLAAPAANAGFFQSVTVDEAGNTNTTTIRTPPPPPPPRKPIFSTTVSTKHKDNGNKVVVTRTYRNGVEVGKERAVTQANRGGGNGRKGR